MESSNLKGESSHCIKATSVAAKQIRKLAQHPASQSFVQGATLWRKSSV